MATHRDYVMIAFDDVIKRRGLKEGVLLDVGCYNQTLRPEFESRGFTWHGCDAFSKCEGVDYAKMEDLRIYPDETYDVVFCCHAFEHCEHPIEALREFKRIVKRGGFIFIATPNPTEHHILLKDDDHIMCLNRMQMTRLLKYVGLKGEVALQWAHTFNENDWNIITLGWKG